MSIESSGAVLTARRDAGAGLTLVTLTPSPELARNYRAAGQFIEVRAAAKGYFALAGAVGATSWELLVRSKGGASETLLSAPEGTTLEVHGPLGSGFPVSRAHGRLLVLAVAGSALAVTRPILAERFGRSEGPSTLVYVGVRSLDEVPLSDEIVRWLDTGARVVFCCSRGLLQDGRTQVPPGHPLAHARCERGYVQNVLADDVKRGLFDGATLFAAGPGAMLEALRLLHHPDGLNVHTNA